MARSRHVPRLGRLGLFSEDRSVGGAGFNVDRHFETLQAMQARLEDGKPLEFTYMRFLIEAVKV